MKYRKPPPDDPNADFIVEATPTEVHAMRPAICVSLLRHGVPWRDIEDLAQNAEIVTWRALQQGKVRGRLPSAPEDALLGFLFGVARCLAANYRVRACNRCEELTSEPEHESDRIRDLWAPRPDLMGQIEARDLLRRLARHNIAAMLVAATLEEPFEERVKSAGMLKATYFYRLERARRWFMEVARSGVWRPPPQAEPPSPGTRKRGR